MKHRLILITAVLALAAAGCADPTTSDEYVELADRLATVEADLEERRTEAADLRSSLTEAEDRASTAETALADLEASSQEELRAAAEREADLESRVAEWQTFAGTAGLREFTPAYRELVMLNCTDGPEPASGETCSCVVDWMQDHLSLEEILYVAEAEVAQLTGTIESDPITGLPATFPDDLAARLSELFFTCF